MCHYSIFIFAVAVMDLDIPCICVQIGIVSGLYTTLNFHNYNRMDMSRHVRVLLLLPGPQLQVVYGQC